MKILVPTSDYYAHLIPCFVNLFNKYWPNQEIKILGFNGIMGHKVPDNVELVKLGNQVDYGNSWTDPLLKYFDTFTDEYFMMVVEDYPLVNYVNLERIDFATKLMENGEVDKIVLHSHLNARCGAGTAFRDDVVVIAQDGIYRTTLHPSIWRTNYFRKFLKPNMTAWQFETDNMPESMNDGATIIAFKSSKQEYWAPMQGSECDNVYNGINIYKKGQIQLDNLRLIKPEDAEEIIKCL